MVYTVLLDLLKERSEHENKIMYGNLKKKTTGLKLSNLMCYSTKLVFPTSLRTDSHLCDDLILKEVHQLLRRYLSVIPERLVFIVFSSV